MKIREGKHTDQENIDKAFILLIELIKKHQKEIEATLWVAAMVCALAENYEKSGYSFLLFEQEMKNCISHYKY